MERDQKLSKVKHGIVDGEGIIPLRQQWCHCWWRGIIPSLLTMPGRILEEVWFLVGYNFEQPMLNSQAIITYQCWYWVDNQPHCHIYYQGSSETLQQALKLLWSLVILLRQAATQAQMLNTVNKEHRTELQSEHQSRTQDASVLVLFVARLFFFRHSF